MEEVDPMTAPALTVKDVFKTYVTSGGKIIRAVAGVDLEIAANSFVCLVGPSGCGKSTLLRIMAGLDSATAGAVTALGRPQTRPRREVGMIFQEYSLFPWRTIMDNITIGPEFNGVKPANRLAEGEKYLELIGMKGYAKAYPHELSGGMRQRVAIARALANEPEILLMDEPFGALDAYTRILLQKRLLDIWEKHRKTVVFVTHSVDEAVFLADSIVVMGTAPGRILTRLEVPIDRPRRRDDPRYAALVAQVLAMLEREAQD